MARNARLCPNVGILGKCIIVRCIYKIRLADIITQYAQCTTRYALTKIIAFIMAILTYTYIGYADIRKRTIIVLPEVNVSNSYSEV